MRKSVITVLLAIVSFNIYSQDKFYVKKHINFPDTSYSERVKFLANFGVDSSYYGKEFPIIQGNKLNNTIFRNDSLREVVVYNFWFIECNPCVNELPLLDSLATEYRDTVDFIAITFNKQQEVIDFIQNHKFGFTQIIMNRKILENTNIQKGYPTTIITKNNKIIYWKNSGQSSDSPYGMDVMNCYGKVLREIINEQINN